MKKMTFLAALLGVTHFSNAQVGIGTATPADAAQLEISAINKGVLIPRVELRNTTTFGPVTGSEIESLLVYNTQTAADVTPGFYYWVSAQTTPAVPAHWERIVNQTQLNEAIGDITDLQGDISKIIELLKVAFPSNNLVDPSVDGDTHGGGMVFTPGATPTIEYVYFDGTDYVTKDITADIIDLITGNETKTKLVTINNVQYYVSESYTGTAAPTTGTEPGVYKIDVVGGIINNFEEFVTNNPVTIDGNTYTTVEEYIQYISENAMQDGVTKIVIDATTNQASFQRWDKTTNTWVNVDNSAFETIVTDNETVTTMTENADGTYTYKNEAGANVVIDIPASVIQELGDIIEGTTTFNNSTATTLVEYIQNMIDNTDLPAGTVTAEIVSGNIVFSIIDANGVANVVPSTAFNNIVKANETETEINKNTTGTAAGGDVEITYDYFNETSGSTAQATIDLTTDIQNLIEGNTDIQNAITNILNEGGNVYYGDHDDDAGTPNIFYTIVNGTKTPIDISEVVVNAITNATNVQKQEIKNQLGDNFQNSTVVNTGDTWIDGGKIYRGIFDATVTGGSANVSAITLTGGTIVNVIGIKILNPSTNQIINTATTEVEVNAGLLTFRIGTGNMYNVLSDDDLNIKVIVEYSVTTP